MVRLLWGRVSADGSADGARRLYIEDVLARGEKDLGCTCTLHSTLSFEEASRSLLPASRAFLRASRILVRPREASLRPLEAWTRPREFSQRPREAVTKL